MRAINEESFQNSLASGSKRRLRDYRVQLASDRDNVIFDDQLADLISEYAINPEDCKEAFVYLENLRDPQGERYSQSRREYSKLKEQFELFTRPNHAPFVWNRNWQKALKFLIELVTKKGNLRQLHYSCDDDIVEAIPKSDTHSGETYLETGRKKKGENMDGVYRKYLSHEEHARKCGSFDRVILPGTRTQGSGAFDDVTGKQTGTCKHKTRLVSMIDLYVIIAELMWAKPFQDLMADLNIYAGGKNDVEISNIIQDARSKWAYWYSLDYSHFDQSISDWMIRDAFKVVRAAFSDQGFDDELFGIIVEDFIHKNFVTADGIIHSDRGVPSGSMFTQILDSLINVLSILTYMYSIGEECQMIVMGDDNLLFANVRIDVEKMSTYLAKNLGLEMNPSKLKFGESARAYCTFLSREWRPGGCWRHPHVLISKMLYPERWRPYGKKEITPEMVLYAYYLAYPAGMCAFLNMERFLSDHHFSDAEIQRKVASRYVPGALSYIQNYTMKKGTKVLEGSKRVA